MSIDDDRLSGYLGDHLLAAESGVRLFESAKRTWQDTEYRSDFDEIRRDVAADRDDLAALIRRLGYTPGRAKMALAWVGAQVSKAGPLNPLHRSDGRNGQLELEALQSAVHGKESLWTSLLALARNDDRLDPEDLQRLKDRARMQQDRIAGIMDRTIIGRFD
ncbi:hypothetical protein [Arthrobacter sp. Br18]|uniref:hypothetical protein n=1 Tax=Arthrobacter sp. Br18 TaxID=1312954 RepID=UPI00047D2A71|nr:hypothetical protein [Arthrobacter sp. Br18]